MSTTTHTDYDACVVAIDVDARQRYIFETDKLREMLGASRIIDATRTKASRDFSEPKGEPVGEQPHLFAPVSGEIRIWAPIAEKKRLLDGAWGLCEELRRDGVEFTVAYFTTSRDAFDEEGLPGTRLEDLYREIGRRIGRQKGAKPAADAQPRCSLFVPCRIHGHDPANRWTPGKPSNETRRQLVGFRAAAKLDAWQNNRGAFYKDLLLKPVWNRVKEIKTKWPGLAPFEINLSRAITFFDLSDMLEGENADPLEDQFIAFICADGDGTGNVLAHLDWNSAEWSDGLKPWQRNAAFSRALEDVIRRALADAIAQALLPDPSDDEERLKKTLKLLCDPQEARANLPFLPQLQGGEDIWVVARKDHALEFSRRLAVLFQEYALKDPIVAGALKIASRLALAADSRLPDEQRQQRPQPKQEVLTISLGVAFAKAGYPVHAMVEAAEALLKSAKKLRKGKADRQLQNPEGCIDWYWIESSLSESVDESRRRGWEYQDGSTLLQLTTRPWSASETDACIEAARALQQIARRKREQIETILRLGKELSEFAWGSWWRGLRKGEQEVLQDKVNRVLPRALKIPNPQQSPWLLPIAPATPLRVNGVEIKSCTASPLLDLLALQHAYGWEGRAQVGDSNGDARGGSADE